MSCGTVPFLVQHTADNISESLRALASSWADLSVDFQGVGWQAICITTDCGSNIAAAVDKPDGVYFWMKCVLHIIHNAVKAGMAAVEDPDAGGSAFRKVRNFVAMMSKSPKKTQ